MRMPIDRRVTAKVGLVGLRDRKRERTHAEIRRTAIRLFAEKGYARTSIAEIAEACEISPATIFRYFPAKGDLLLAERRERLDGLAEAIARHRAAAPARSVVRSIMHQWADDLDLEVMRLVETTPALAAEASLIRLALTEALSAAVQGRFPGADAGVDAAAHAVAGIWPAYAARLRWIEENGTRDAAAVLDEAFRTLDDAARAEPLSEPLQWMENEDIALADEVRLELHGLRERKALRLRNDLLRIALELFHERGYEATTVEEIAARAGVSTRTLFRYFASKDDLLLDGPMKRADLLRDLVLARPASEGPMTAARHALRILLIATYDTPSPQMRTFGQLFTTRSELQPYLMKARNHWGVVLGAALAERMQCDRTALAPNAIAVTVQWAAHDGMHRWLTIPGRQTLGHNVVASFAALHRVLAA